MTLATTDQSPDSTVRHPVTNGGDSLIQTLAMLHILTGITLLF
jgi:hypothetical protein